MKKLILLFIAALCTFQAVSQNAKYDLRFSIYSLDCINGKLLLDLEVRATDPSAHFNIADVNIRFTYGSALANPVIEQELVLSGTVQTTTPQTLSLYAQHHLQGTINNVVSYNVVLSGGHGYPIDDLSYIPIGRLSFDIIDYNLPLDFTFLSQLNGNFPVTTVIEKFNSSLRQAQEGTYLDHLDYNVCGYGGMKLRPKLFLEGPFDSSKREMKIGANSAGVIPIAQPYTALGMHIGFETTTAAVITNHNIVDWVLVQVRSPSNPSIILGSAAALVDNEGNVTDADGLSPVTFDLYQGPAYVSVIHRNHLSIMTKNSIDIQHLTIEPIDFTTIPLYGNNAAKKDNDDQVMWAGDSDTNGTINAADRSNAWNDRNLQQYLRTDFTLDGVINAADRSIGWNNRNLTAQTP